MLLLSAILLCAEDVVLLHTMFRNRQTTSKYVAIVLLASYSRNMTFTSRHFDKLQRIYSPILQFMTLSLKFVFNLSETSFYDCFAKSFCHQIISICFTKSESLQTSGYFLQIVNENRYIVFWTYSTTKALWYEDYT